MSKHTRLSPHLALVTVGGRVSVSLSVPGSISSHTSIQLEPDEARRMGAALLEHAGAIEPAPAPIRPLGTPLPLPPSHLIPRRLEHDE